MDENEVPITSITNGVHAPTWVHPDLKALSEQAFGDAKTAIHDWTNTEKVTDEELWGVRRSMKEDLVNEARERMSQAALDNGNHVPAWMQNLLDPDVLTIGFARRVPTYKRLTLMLRDPGTTGKSY
uniref:CAZy families GT35 protein n=1 Tax=uncultured Arthrobacter sp. TaxID=114050 RepID=A0A060BXG6_9MICC|nr:CAZy families GT35 protein [uncultured Arthrobacter sp.]